MSVRWSHWPEGAAAFNDREKERQQAFAEVHEGRVERTERKQQKREALKRGECPFCGAKAGEPCHRASGRVKKRPHKAREEVTT